MFVARARPNHDPRLASPAPQPPALALFVVFLLAAFLLRSPGILRAAIDPDEGLYILQAQAWMGGGWPYLAVWDMHPPGAPALLMPVLAVVGDPVLALRLTGVLAVATTASLLCGTARLLGAGSATSLAAGLLFIAYSVLPGGLATNTEILFAPFVAAVARLLLNDVLRGHPPRASLVFAAGLCAGVALWVKQTTALESSALWLTMLGLAMAARPIAWWRVAVQAALFALGAGAPTLGVAAGYAATGHFEPWLRGNLLAPLAYPGEDGIAPGLRLGLAVALPPLSPLLLACAGLAFPDPLARRAGLLLSPWLGAAALAVALPGKWYDHYFLVLAAPLSIIAAFALAAIARHALRPELSRPGFAILVGLSAAVPVAAMLHPRLAHGIGLREADPVRQVAHAVTRELRPGEALFVANWHSITYALARQRPPTRYAFPFHLSGRIQGLTGEDMDAELARVLAIPPGVIVLAADEVRWRGMRAAARAAIETQVRRDYDLVASVHDGVGEVQVWRRR